MIEIVTQNRVEKRPRELADARAISI